MNIHIKTQNKMSVNQIPQQMKSIMHHNQVGLIPECESDSV